MRMKKVLSIVLVTLLLASAVPLVITPAGAQQAGIPFAGEDNELTKEELVNSILPYMLDEGDLKLDDVGDAAYVYAYWDGKPKTVIDSDDKEVTIYRPIERIVFTWLDGIEMFRALQMPTETIVGVPHRISIKSGAMYNEKYAFLFPEFSEVPGVEIKADVESILNLHPDAVVYRGFSGGTTAPNAFGAAGIGFFNFVSYKQEPVVYKQMARAFGDLFGKEDEAEEFIEWRENSLNAIKERVEENVPEENKTCVYLGSYSSGKFNIRGGPQITAVGGKNIFDIESGTLDPEELVKRNPDVIIIYSHASYNCYGTDDITESDLKEDRDAVMYELTWQDVTAVKEGRVYTISTGIGCCPGAYRYFIALPYMAKFIYPELFEDLDPVAFNQEYLTRFQGLDYDVEKHGVFVYHPEQFPEGR